MPAIFFALFSTLVSLSAPARNADQEWSEIERQMELEQQALEVNEGELQLLEQAPEAASHHHENRLRLTRQSLQDGWVTLYQCHSNLDPVSALQIVYSDTPMRDISILSRENIGSAWVDGQTVQLKDIGEDARICITADKRALVFRDGKYHLKLGPFMRRFLDGYYPMHVRVEVCYPSFLELVSSSPVRAMQRTRDEASYAEIDVWVVGKLDIEMVFAGSQPAGQ